MYWCELTADESAVKAIHRVAGSVKLPADDLRVIAYLNPPVEPDPDELLDDAIRGANNFQELKTALLGRTRGRKL